MKELTELWLKFYESVLLCKMIVLSQNRKDLDLRSFPHINKDFLQEIERNKGLGAFQCIKNSLSEQIDQANMLAAKGYLIKTIRSSQFIMCGFADEVFINLDWESANEWARSPIEMEKFKTKRAGQKIFEDASAYIANHSIADRELGIIYFSALAGGFLGMYRDDYANDKSPVEIIKQGLLKAANADYEFDPNKASVVDAQPYAHTISRNVSDIGYSYAVVYQQITFALLFCAALLFGCGYYMCNSFVFDVNKQILDKL